MSNNNAQKIKIAADNGNIQCMLKYGLMLEEGKEVSKNLEQSADKGSIEAIQLYATILKTG